MFVAFVAISQTDVHVLIYSSSVRNAVATLTKTPITLEVLYGNQLTIICTIEGGSRPDYLKLSSTSATIAEFTSANITSVTSKTDNSVTYIHQTTAKYTDTSTYTCLGKNKAKGGAETEDSKTVQVIVGKYYIVKKSPSSLKVFSKCIFLLIFLRGGGGGGPRQIFLENQI